MKINGQILTNKYDNKLNEIDLNKKVNTSNKVKNESKNGINNNINNDKLYNSLLTKQERNYFKKLFPESVEIIEKHILFNRNAKIQNIETAKGIFVDGKI